MKGTHKACFAMALQPLLLLVVASALWGAHSTHAFSVPAHLLQEYIGEARAESDTTFESTDAGVTTEGPTEEGGTEGSPATEAPGTTTMDPRDPTDEALAEQELDDMADYLQPIFVDYQEASWVENTDHSEEHSNAAINATAKLSSAYATQWKNVIDYYVYQNFTNEALRRRFELQATPGTAALSEEDQQALSSAVNSMTALSLEKVCPFEKQDCNRDTEGYTMDELEVVLASSRNADALSYYWLEWRDTAGAPAKPYFNNYVALMNKAAKDPQNGFSDAGEMWLQPYISTDYTTDDFKSDIETLWDDMKEFYQKLHTYVRYRLRDSGPYADTFGENSPIPAHILGNMWAQSWENIYDLVVPYKDTPLIDISETLQNNITDAKVMFRYAENFFKSLGLYEMTADFWGKSMFTQPENAIAVCHASAWDFLSVTAAGPINDGDFRIKMCADLNQEDFITIHHEMGHIEYQMAYSQLADNDPTLQPLVFRDGANPGFHEAIGDTIALSVSTPSHLLALQNNISAVTTTPAPDVDTYERDINQLMRMALEKVAFIPYAYILDKFRWDVFAKKYAADVYNYEWWKLRVSVQGLKPPVLREKDDDFDPGCKYHVAANVPYIRYFVANILQFQFHERLCEVGGITEVNVTEVYECDIYGNMDSGNALKNLLRPGRSVPWTEQLATFMGVGNNPNMTSAAIRQYFAPLEAFLDKQIADNDLKLGWEDDVDQYFVQHIPATVPIVVGVVLAVMIVVVVVAYFVGVNKNNKKKNEAPTTTDESKAPKDNEGFEMDEKKSVSSSDSEKSKE